MSHGQSENGDRDEWRRVKRIDVLAVCSHVLSVSASFFPTFNSLHMLELVVSVFSLSLSLFFIPIPFFYFWCMANVVILIIISLGLPDYLPQVRVTRTIELETFLFHSLSFHTYIFCLSLSWKVMHSIQHARERVCLIVNVNKVKMLK